MREDSDLAAILELGEEVQELMGYFVPAQLVAQEFEKAFLV